MTLATANGEEVRVSELDEERRQMRAERRRGKAGLVAARGTTHDDSTTHDSGASQAQSPAVCASASGAEEDRFLELALQHRSQDVRAGAALVWAGSSSVFFKANQKQMHEVSRAVESMDFPICIFSILK